MLDREEVSADKPHEKIIAALFSYLLYGKLAALSEKDLEKPLQDTNLIAQKCIDQEESTLKAYLKMQKERLDYLVLLDEDNKIAGVVFRDGLLGTLFPGGL